MKQWIDQMFVKRGDTARLMCPVTGAFRGLVRVKREAFHDGIHRGGLYTVIAETPILDWLSTSEDGAYPHRMPYEVGHVFNAEGVELSPTLTWPYHAPLAVPDQAGADMLK